MSPSRTQRAVAPATPVQHVVARPGRPRAKVALALAGGGPLGAIYEIGALCALDEALQGLDLHACHHYVGVSAGGFIAAGLANGMTPRELCHLFIATGTDDGETFDPAWLMRPAYAELAHRLAMLPGLGLKTLWAWTLGRKPLISALEKMAPALPTGLFSNEEVDRQLARLFSKPGRTNDFRQLPQRLTLVATHLDSGEAAPFGRQGWDHVPISKAIAASAALPGLFPPVEIDGRFYVDGALKKTMHASVALDEGVDVMFCLNPLVPFDATLPDVQRVGQRHGQPIPSMTEGGFPAVMSQTFRSMIHSRLELGMKQYESSYPNTAIVLIEPDHRDAELFLANTFSYHQRSRLAEHAYQQTRQLLRAQYTTLSNKLGPHGIGLNREVLGDPTRHLLPPDAERPRHRPAAGAPRRRLGAALDRLQDSVDDLQHAVANGTVTHR
ncbi:MAG: patatin [Polaromonas sp.]|nr:patatin [Polaromonas sp.]